MKLRLFLIVLINLSSAGLFAQNIIRGEITDFETNSALENVNIRNIYNLNGMTTQSDGKFMLEIKKGELFECSKVGYQTIRIRITNEKEPNFYKLVMQKVPIQLREVDIKGKPLDFKKDSIRYRQVYNLELSKESKDEIDMRSMPLAMLSKKTRQEWAFQEMYKEWEREKYIDFVFNERLVNRITYLEGEELETFLRIYRPRYEFLREASQYEFLDYIKHCYYLFENQKR